MQMVEKTKERKMLMKWDLEETKESSVWVRTANTQITQDQVTPGHAANFGNNGMDWI